MNLVKLERLQKNLAYQFRIGLDRLFKRESAELKHGRRLGMTEQTAGFTPRPGAVGQQRHITTNPNSPLYGASLKVVRAVEHLNRLHELNQCFADPHFCALHPHEHSDGGVKWVFGKPKPIPMEIPIAIGEAAHQLRSSLDHIAFHFATPIAGKEGKVQMPLCTSAKKFRDAEWRIPGIDAGSEVFLEIKRIQPYFRRSRPDNWLLWQVARINNWDKHRFLPITTAAITSSEFMFGVGDDSWTAQDGDVTGIIEEGKEFVTTAPDDLSLEAKQYTGVQLSVNPVFQHTLPVEIANLSYMDIISRAALHITDEVLPRFEKLL